MNMTFPPEHASFFRQSATSLGRAARELALFGEVDPELARECGIEVGALEARTILSGGAPARIATAADEALRTGRSVSVTRDDVEALSRLNAVVALNSSRIGIQMAALAAAESQDRMAQLGSMIGLATGAVGLIKSIF